MSSAIDDVGVRGVLEALSLVPEAIAVVDPAGRPVFATPAATALAGSPLRVIRYAPAPLRDSLGSAVGTVLSMADVTAQKRERERLYFDRLLDQSDDAI